ncbi:hypothetical protein O6H91_03G070200 [Diphasiastrum complanatum]|uniref:Uncharacterized protein n=1 Tax=Diphasiastrum complanatum TaxID=34168 RepID=A0ACC2E7C5_DIPCM|nr:hypothetical protein O6H91_03G070200 [Diphasiastrum complanatum]
MFPYFNGGSLDDTMMKLPIKNGSFRRAMAKLQGNGKIKNSQVDSIIASDEMVKIKSICDNVCGISHAFVQTMAFAHNKFLLHCDLHVVNVMIDFTNQMHPRIGVIDWRMAVRVQYESKKSWVANPTTHALRPWLAPELLNCNHVYTRATDTWSVAWLITEFITFCEEFCKLHYPDWNKSLAATNVEHIKYIIAKEYYIVDEHARRNLQDLDKNLKKFNLHPDQYLRPMAKMMPTFYIFSNLQILCTKNKERI